MANRGDNVLEFDCISMNFILAWQLFGEVSENLKWLTFFISVKEVLQKFEAKEHYLGGFQIGRDNWLWLYP